MHEVKCPECGQSRFVKAKKPWMTGTSPYSKICKSCCQIGKQKSDEHKAKLSESAKAAQTDEILQNKSEFQKQHPEFWKGQIATGVGGGWNKGLTMPAMSEETKQKISDGVKAAKGKKQ